AVDERAAEPERKRAVKAAAEERPHRDDETVTTRIVEQGARDRRDEDARDAGEPRERQDRLLSSVRSFVRVVVQRREDRPRCLQDEQRAEQPIALERCRLSRSGQRPKATRAPEVAAGPPGCTRRRRPRRAFP